VVRNSIDRTADPCAGEAHFIKCGHVTVKSKASPSYKPQVCFSEPKEKIADHGTVTVEPVVAQGQCVKE